MRKFDPARVIQDSELFQEPRPPASPGEVRATERIAAMFTEAGWEVAFVAEDQIPGAHSTGFFEALVSISGWVATIFLLFTWLAFFLAVLFPGSPSAFLLGMPTAFLLFVAMHRWRRQLRTRRNEAEFPAKLVVARVPRTDPPGRRLAVIAQTTRPPSPTNERINKFLKYYRYFVYYTVVFVVFSFLLGIKKTPLSLHPAAAAAFLLFLLVSLPLSTLYEPRCGPPHRGDERTSLAFLAELAGTWPSRAEVGMETWLIAAPDRFQGGDPIWERLLRQAMTDQPPTLVLLVSAVGLGPMLTISGEGPSAELVWQSADSLRIPFRRLRVPSFRKSKPPRVGISGEPGDLPIEPSMIAAVAQLVTEVAFRWAKSG